MINKENEEIMNEKKECEFISQNDVNKALLHCNWANRRMFIALIVVCLTFIIVVMINTVRETRWQNTVKDLQLQMTNAIMEIQNNGQRTD